VTPGRSDRYPTKVGGCGVCDVDRAFLRASERPRYEEGSDPVRVVDLFCGCGGLTLGIAEAARAADRALEVVLGIDADADAVAVYQANFPMAQVIRDRVERWFDGQLGSPLTATEQRVVTQVGRVDVLAAGAPCQGHSDLNNHTRRIDERNLLYLRVARAAEVLRPKALLIENVPAVLRDSERVVVKTRRVLDAIGYSVDDGVIGLITLGTPQLRRRHVLLAHRGKSIGALSALRPRCDVHPQRDLEWAIGDLRDVAAPRGIDTPSKTSRDNEARISWLFEHGKFDLPNDLRPICHQSEHSYISMYGRLRWDRPAQTITTGFGSMGQGRYVHPSRRRTITAHEAARIQMLPDFFDLSAARSRGAVAALVGNAVPPPLAMRLTLPLLMPSSDQELTAAAGGGVALSSVASA
jgi:DNA (cytosine-5)-methyltransferase 1